MSTIVYQAQQQPSRASGLSLVSPTRASSRYEVFSQTTICIMTTLVVMVGGCGNYLGSELFESIYTEGQRAALSGNRNTRESLMRRFFTSCEPNVGGGTLKARGLLIDMEAKTVQNCLLRRPALPDRNCQSVASTSRSSCKIPPNERTASWFWDPKFAYWQQGGCGNNWALGHEVQGPSHRDTLERLVLSLAEESDIVSTVLLVHSVAGGTGSGVGSYMTELCADLLPECCIASCCVWPFDAEVSTQSFNTVLSLAALQRYSDGVFLFENARCAKILRSHAASRPAAVEADLTAINRCIVRSLMGCSLIPSASLTFPCNDAYASSTRQPNMSGDHKQASRLTGTRALVSSHFDVMASRRCPLRELLGEVATHPAYKLLTCRYLPQSHIPQQPISYLSPYNFSSLLRRLQRMFNRADTLDLHTHPSPTTPSRIRRNRYTEAQQRHHNQLENVETGDVAPNAAVAAQFCLRGPGVNAGVPVDDCKISLWPYALNPVQVSAHPFAPFGEPCSVALTTSCRTPLPALWSTLQAGVNMLDARAFVHHYEEFGVGAEELRLALEQLEETVEAYAALQPT